MTTFAEICGKILNESLEETCPELKVYLSNLAGEANDAKEKLAKLTPEELQAEKHVQIFIEDALNMADEVMSLPIKDEEWKKLNTLQISQIRNTFAIYKKKFALILDCVAESKYDGKKLVKAYCDAMDCMESCIKISDMIQANGQWHHG